MTFEKYLEENQVDKENEVAVGRAAKVFMRGKENFFTEEEKAWVNKGLAAQQKAMEDYQRSSKLVQLEKLLPKLP